MKEELADGVSRNLWWGKSTDGVGNRTGIDGAEVLAEGTGGDTAEGAMGR